MSGTGNSSQSALASSTPGARDPDLPDQSPLAQRSSIFDNESDSDESQPDRRPITRIVTSAKTADPQQPNASLQRGSVPSVNADAGTPASRDQGSDPTQSGPLQKDSQIALLVKRRKTMQQELAPHLEQDSRDSALFRYDLDKCPDHSDTRAYERTPVEGFGETMLRAMGWKGSVSANKGQTVKLRPPRLGLGVELGGVPPPSRRAQKRARPQEITDKPEASKETLKGLSSEDEVSGFDKSSNKARDGSGETNRSVLRAHVGCLQSKISTRKKELKRVSSPPGSLLVNGGEDKWENPVQSHERPVHRVSNLTHRGRKARQHGPQDQREGQRAHGGAESGQILTIQRNKSASERNGGIMSSGGHHRRADVHTRREQFEKQGESQDGHNEGGGRWSYEEDIRPRRSATRDDQQNSRGRRRMSSGIEGYEKRREGAGYSWDETDSRSREKKEPRSMEYSGGRGHGGKTDKIAEFDNGPKDNQRGYEREPQHVYSQRYTSGERVDRNEREAVRTSRRRRSRFSDSG